jgi:hypothetical protein
MNLKFKGRHESKLREVVRAETTTLRGYKPPDELKRIEDAEVARLRPLWEKTSLSAQAILDIRKAQQQPPVSAEEAIRRAEVHFNSRVPLAETAIERQAKSRSAWAAANAIPELKAALAVGNCANSPPVASAIYEAFTDHSRWSDGPIARSPDAILK